MNRPVKALLAAVAMLAVTAFGPPASADPPVWVGVACAEGAMTAQSLPARTVEVSGWIRPCAGAAAVVDSWFAVTYYGPTVGAPGRRMHYADQAQPTPFHGQLDRMKLLDDVAVCLAFSDAGRVSCLSVTAVGDSDVLVVEPIAADDPRVLVPIRLRPEGATHPTCGTCV